jgi:hypothetical protein
VRQSERLWHLACRYRMGATFYGIWVEDSNIVDVATRLGASPSSGVRCGWADITSDLDPGEDNKLAWVGQLTENWTQIIAIDPPTIDPLPALSSGNRRALRICWTVNEVNDLYLAFNGQYMTSFSVTRPGVRGGPAPHALDSYASGLQFDARDSSWEADPDASPGWAEYSRWEEAQLEEGSPEDDYEGMQPGWGSLMELALNGYSPPIATCITSAFTLVGRVTGREFDESWMEDIHTRFVI